MAAKRHAALSAHGDLYHSPPSITREIMVTAAFLGAMIVSVLLFVLWTWWDLKKGKVEDVESCANLSQPGLPQCDVHHQVGELDEPGKFEEPKEGEENEEGKIGTKEEGAQNVAGAGNVDEDNREDPSEQPGLVNQSHAFAKTTAVVDNTGDESAAFAGADSGGSIPMVDMKGSNVSRDLKIETEQHDSKWWIKGW